MKMRKKLYKRKDRKFFTNTANRTVSTNISIGQRGGRRI